MECGFLQRGDIVTVALSGDYGKPHPALVIQSNNFMEHTSITVLPITSTIVNAPLLRISLEPDDKNHLEKISQVMIDKIMTVKKEKIGKPVGSIQGKVLREIERNLILFLGIAK